MTDGRGRVAWALTLALAFAVEVGMTVALAGRVPAAPLAASQALGALVVALILAGRPLAVVRALDARSRLLACAAGLVGVIGPPAAIAAVRMSDAPAGSIVVFWIAGGWAVLAAAAAAVASLHSRAPGRAVLALAGGVAALAGVAGVVANWERPSSFSPLVRFPGPEVAILAAGALLLAGAYLVVRAAGAGRLDGALVCATAAASVAGLAWWAVAGLTRGLSSVAEQPVESALVALAWGCVVVTLPRMLRREGAARVGALFAVAPLLLSALIWLEQAVGVAGPQPLIVTGVAAGGVTIAAAFLVLWWSRVADPVSGRKPLMLAVAAVPLALAGVALALPAVVARADVSGATGSFVGSWTLLGWESVAGLSALALAALLASLAWTRAAAMPALVALVACAVWPWNLATPMHVLTGWLTPGIEQYYGTEYGSISFTAVSNVWMIAAVAACAAGLVVLIVSELPRRARRAAAKSGE